MAWVEIKDLPADWESLASGEVESLAETWFNIYHDLKDTSLLDTFNERLRREWSIETGIIERLYTIDSGTIAVLDGL
ncbi:hypothetical protein [Candidatus Chloroploca sp. Khr17]|uniref:hypothetical protein n=1 Tax=Candidatus Chloroploca sp. Khr17 TaxID=2496869 RepID=UPI00101CB4CE|nr:hypothetical protein [Candidatus Chloroploca sp. Khr17]